MTEQDDRVRAAAWHALRFLSGWHAATPNQNLVPVIEQLRAALDPKPDTPIRVRHHH